MVGCPLVGCSKNDRRPRTFPTTGKLLIRGKPYRGIMVVLRPAEGDDQRFPSPRGTRQADGSFRLTTFKTGDGAPAGEYKVVIIYDSDTSPLAKNVRRPAISAKYQSRAETPLRATVHAEAVNDIPTMRLP